MNIDATTVVFAVVAIFVAWRLWSVLGTRTGTERPPVQAPRPGRMGGEVIDVTPNPAPPPPAADRWRGVAEPGSNVARGLDAIAAGDPTFDVQAFLQGARGAYEFIIGAFAAGDVETLRPYLGAEPFANFSRAIEARKSAGQKMVVTIVSIDRADIVEAAVQKGVAGVAVKFASKMNSVTTDSAEAVVDGAPSEVVEHVEVWTFERPLSSRDPNWLLTATEASH